MYCNIYPFSYQGQITLGPVSLAQYTPSSGGHMSSTAAAHRVGSQPVSRPPTPGQSALLRGQKGSSLVNLQQTKNMHHGQQFVVSPLGQLTSKPMTMITQPQHQALAVRPLKRLPGIKADTLYNYRLLMRSTPDREDRLIDYCVACKA